MIIRNGINISAIWHGTRAIAAVYKGAALVWQSVRSCFGTGVWVDEKPWLDEETWKNTK